MLDHGSSSSVENFSYGQPLRPGTVKQESDSEIQGLEEPPSASPPRKRFRMTTASLPHRGAPSYTSGDLQDWHRNRSDHPHNYSQVWSSTGWINASYPVGITQLDSQSHQDGSYEEPHEGYAAAAAARNPDSFAPDGSLVAARNSSVHHFQNRKFFHPKQTVIDDSVNQMQHLRRFTDSIQRVPDVTTVPELSPSGYVLTPAPTPPDAESAPPCFPTLDPISISEIEQRVPISDRQFHAAAPATALYSSAQALAELRPVVSTVDPLRHYHLIHSTESMDMDYQAIPHAAESSPELIPEPR